MLVIKNLEKELAQEEEIRRYKAEYDQLAAEINEQKTREESLKYLNNIIFNSQFKDLDMKIRINKLFFFNK